MKTAESLLVKYISICGSVQFVIELNTQVFVVHHSYNVPSLDVLQHKKGGLFAKVDHQLLRLASFDAKVVQFTPTDKVPDDPSIFQLIPLQHPANNSRVIREILASLSVL